MKVTLFFQICHIYIGKFKPEKDELWGFGDQWVLDQMTWDQNFWVLFDDV